MKNTILPLFIFLLPIASVIAQSPAGNVVQHPAPMERMKHVSDMFDKELKLTVEQKEKLTEAYKAFFAGMEKLRNNEGNPVPPPPPPVNREAIEKLSKERDTQIKALLSDEQFKKYMDLEKKMRPHAPSGKSGEPQPPKENKE